MHGHHTARTRGATRTNRKARGIRHDEVRIRFPSVHIFVPPLDKCLDSPVLDFSFFSFFLFFVFLVEFLKKNKIGGDHLLFRDQALWREV